MKLAACRLLCMACRVEYFSTLPPPEIMTCPGCGSNTMPALANVTATITLTIQEIRLLTYWSTNWARHLGDSESIRSVHGILGAIGEQVSELAPEFEDLKSRTKAPCRSSKEGE